MRDVDGAIRMLRNKGMTVRLIAESLRLHPFFVLKRLRAMGLKTNNSTQMLRLEPDLAFKTNHAYRKRKEKQT